MKKTLFLLLVCFNSYSMERRKTEEDISHIVISFYLNPDKKQSPINRLAPIIGNKLKESQELNPNVYKQQTVTRLKEIYNKLRESPKADEQLKEIRKDTEMLDVVREIVNEALEDYIVEQEMQKKMLKSESEDLDKKLRQQRILAYIGAGTTLCTTFLGIITTVLVATL